MGLSFECPLSLDFFPKILNDRVVNTRSLKVLGYISNIFYARASSAPRLDRHLSNVGEAILSDDVSAFIHRNKSGHLFSTLKRDRVLPQRERWTFTL